MSGCLVYGGHDFSELVSAEVVHDACVPSDTESVRVPGRAGRILCAVEPGVRVVRMRLKLLRECCRGELRDAAFMRIGGWLASSGGSDLELGDGCVLHDVVCTGCKSWTLVSGEETCEVEFTCFDPVRYGKRVSYEVPSFDVAGSWKSWPVLELEAHEAASGVCVRHEPSGRFVRLVRAFEGGERVVLDCGDGRVLVDEIGGERCVDVASDFFWLEPGENLIALEGCELVSVSYQEAWL